MAPTHLIIGASGYIGARLHSLLGPGRAVATYHAKPLEAGVRFSAGETDIRQVLDDCPGVRYAHVLFGVTNMDLCAREPVATARINVDSVCQVIDELFERGIVPLYASSDAVFDGVTGNYVETDELRPVLTYGKQKAEVEKHLQGCRGRWIIARPGKTVGVEPGRGNMLGDWMDRLAAGEEILCAEDQVFSPVDVEDVAGAMIDLVEGTHQGIFHLAGPRALSRLEFVRIAERAMCEAGIAVRGTIRSCRLNDLPLLEPRPLKSAMVSARAYAALGRVFSDMNEVCGRAAARLAEGCHASALSAGASS